MSVLPTGSKINFEKMISTQLGSSFKEINFFFLFLCGFWIGHITQYALLRLLNRSQSSLGKSEIVGTVLMDPSITVFLIIN